MNEEFSDFISVDIETKISKPFDYVEYSVIVKKLPVPEFNKISERENHEIV